jgi:hypothetical protein
VQQFPGRFKAQGDHWYEGQTELPRWVDREGYLNAPVSLLGAQLAGEQEQIRLRAPDPAQRGLLDLRPTFECEDKDPTWQVVLSLRVLSKRGDDREVELPMDETSADGVCRATPRSDLTPGSDYRLKIERRRRGEGELTVESPPAYVFDFRVLTREEMAHANWAEAHASQAPVTCAAILNRLERYRTALNALRNARQDKQVEPLMRGLETRVKAAEVLKRYEPEP